jgi:pyruvate dehydrogenase E1 component
MLKTKVEAPDDLNPQETSEWIEALDEIIDAAGPDRASYLLQRLIERAANLSVQLPLRYNTAYINTIPPEDEVAYPGNRQIERKIKSYVRWNATAMVVRANKYDANIGGHLATYASLATLLEVGFNHFFRGSYAGPNGEKLPGDFVYFQGHASPGVYARAFLEGRLSEEHLKNFRHELRDHPGLSSYPHPWLMPDFWQFPTVSMGLGPISAIYQARFQKYLENRGLIPESGRKIWAFLGDGECDEPESLGALTLGPREKLDNLIFVINCNLQRLDGPVRGNGSIVQELEALFRGAGWNVIKCLWGSGWDDLLARDASGLLIKRFHEVVDGEYQAYRANDGAYLRKEFFGKYPELLKLVEHMSDDDLWALRRGGLDPVKVFNAYRNAMQTTGRPTVILAKTVKGYGLGEIAEGRNTAHQQKKLGESDLLKIRDRFSLPLTDEQATHLEFIKPAEDSPEMQYLRQRASAQGGYLPERKVKGAQITAPALSSFQDTLGGSRGREASTTAAFVAVLKALMKTDIGKYVVPIVPDEARTFGMESLFRECGIYASQGQRYKPVDANVLLYYKEAQDGQILEEGINEAGSMASCLAAGTAYANHGVPMIPFYIYYSMFGFQRVGDQIWQFGDSRGKGFLLGGTAGRTTLLGEGLQHQDGHSPLHASTIPNCIVYDPAYAYELAVIVQDGIRRMYQEMENHFYYLTVYNENYVQPPMPDRPGIVEGILKGIYKYQPAQQTGGLVAQLFGSGPMLNEALKAQKILAEKYQIAADVWSVTSYNELRREALEVDRWNRLNPTESARVPHITQVMQNERGPIVASSDYMKAQAHQLSPWLGSRLTSLGTDGFGRSENREHLRKFFEISADAIVQATLAALARNGDLDPHIAAAATAEFGFDPNSPARTHL